MDGSTSNLYFGLPCISFLIALIFSVIAFFIVVIVVFVLVVVGPIIILFSRSLWPTAPWSSSSLGASRFLMQSQVGFCEKLSTSILLLKIFIFVIFEQLRHTEFV